MKAEAITSLLSTGTFGRPVICLDCVGSTNDHARKIGESEGGHGTLVIAETQTAGRGRRGRTWDSPPGTGVFMSLLLKPDFSPAAASGITLVAAMAIREGIFQVTGLDPRIKWPNDLVIDGKKICGILTEMSTIEGRIRSIVVGCGINVNTESFPEELAQTATSLYLAGGCKVDREKLIAAVMNAFEADYGRFQQTGDLSLLKADYEAHLINFGRSVTVLAAAGSFQGISRGITDTGSLLVETADGSLREVLSGEVSVRGVYGYV